MPSIHQVISELEAKSLGNRLAAREEDTDTSWRGFVFRVDRWDIAVPFVGGFEIVPYQPLSPLPMTMPWVSGVTNVRGDIYTVVDFSRFIGGSPVRNLKVSNLFLLPDEGLKAALLIEGRISLRAFSSGLQTSGSGGFQDTLDQYLNAVLLEDETSWGVLDVRRLCNSEKFVNIGWRSAA